MTSRRYRVLNKQFPIMKKRCVSCPFNPDGDAILRESVLSRTLFQSSQLCHHPILSRRKETHLCRGQRDVQLELLARMGMIEAPTDEAFEKRWKELQRKDV
jgi:hypothetical protein